MRKCSRVAGSRSRRKSESSLKQVDCNLRRAGCSSKPAASNWKRQAVEALAQVKVLHRRHNHRQNINTNTIRRSNDPVNTIRLVLSISVAGLLVGCAATGPPLVPQNNPADSQVRNSSKSPRNVLVRDETTLAIEKQLSATEADAKNAESMHHDMSNMPGMQQGAIQGMQHDGM